MPRFKRARHVGAGFYLQGRVANTKITMKLIGDAQSEFIAGITVGHHEVTRKCDFGCAQRPDVKIVNLLDAWPGG
jgi:hypothetical protein